MLGPIFEDLHAKRIDSLANGAVGVLGAARLRATHIRDADRRWAQTGEVCGSNAQCESNACDNESGTCRERYCEVTR